MTEDHTLPDFQVVQTQKIHAETFSLFLEDAWEIKMCSKIRSKYKTHLISSYWMES